MYASVPICCSYHDTCLNRHQPFCMQTPVDTSCNALQVADFGLSRLASSTTVDTDTYGTVTHMPPELLMEGKLTKSADVYAFGVLLWELYTGQAMPRPGCMLHAQALNYTGPVPFVCQTCEKRCQAGARLMSPCFCAQLQPRCCTCCPQ